MNHIISNFSIFLFCERRHKIRKGQSFIITEFIQLIRVICIRGCDDIYISSSFNLLDYNLTLNNICTFGIIVCFVGDKSDTPLGEMIEGCYLI